MQEVTNIDEFTPLLHNKIINKPIDKKISDTYVQSKEINTMFSMILSDIGIDLTDTSNIILTDKD